MLLLKTKGKATRLYRHEYAMGARGIFLAQFKLEEETKWKFLKLVTN